MNTKINALVLIFINLIIPFSAMFAHNIFVTFFLFLFSAVLLLRFGKIRRFLKYSIAFLALGMIYYLLLHFRIPHTDVFAMSFFILFHFIPLMMIASLLFYDYGPSEILSTLQLLKLNRKFTIALTIALRYIPTFQAEFKIMKSSMAMRGIAFSWKRPLQSFSYFITPQLFRCSLLAEELTAAGITKGIEYHGVRTSIYNIKWKKSDSFWLISFLLGFITIILWGGHL
ncbi:energy-coupling factor transporter transmembrane protein EcfT [Clostridiales bacterium COT073_COT-073]|nr:energy-coupling factor transporter transmembrane protein EcfT [Clostridiales bacterium COT073_COT-073]